MIPQHDIGCRDNNARRMTATLPQTGRRANPISGTNSSIRQPRRPESKRTAYYYLRCRDNEWKLRGLPHNGRQAEAEITSFLATLQERGRLVDFLMEDITT